MKFPQIFVSILLISLFFSCQSSSSSSSEEKDTAHTEAQKAEQEQKRLEVMAVHDAVMPQTAVVNRLSRQIKAYMKERTEQGDQDESRQEILLEAVKHLNQADEAMYDWMGKFYNNLDLLRDSMDHQGVMDYLDAELVKIKKVDEMTKTSMEKARAVMEEYGINEQ